MSKENQQENNQRQNPQRTQEAVWKVKEKRYMVAIVLLVLALAFILLVSYQLKPSWEITFLFLGLGIVFIVYMWLMGNKPAKDFYKIVQEIALKEKDQFGNSLDSKDPMIWGDRFGNYQAIQFTKNNCTFLYDIVLNAVVGRKITPIDSQIRQRDRSEMLKAFTMQHPEIQQQKIMEEFGININDLNQ